MTDNPRGEILYLLNFSMATEKTCLLNYPGLEISHMRYLSQCVYCALFGRS
jgi:hypothetical protein